MTTEDKHKLVIDHWFANGFNGAAAYREVYPKSSEDTSKSNFTKLLTLTYIQEYIQEKHKEARELSKISHESLLYKLKLWLESDLTEFMELTASEIKELPLEIRQLVTEFKRTTKKLGTTTDPVLEETITLKFVSKDHALDRIAKHIGFYEKDNHQKNKILYGAELADQEEKEKYV